MTVYTSVEFMRFTRSLADENIKTVARYLNNYLETCEHKTRAAAVSASYHPGVIRAVRERDTAELLKLLNPMLALHNISYITIADENRMVLARTFEPSRYGEQLSPIQNITDALEGKVSTYYESGPLIRISVHTGAPIYDEGGTLIGVISAGERFDTNETLDVLKDRFDVEMSVFLDNTRIATTMVRNGERLESGPPLDPKIAKKMAEEKTEYFDHAYVVLDETFNAFLKPLINSKNEVVAVLIIGDANTQLIKAAHSLLTSCIFIGFLGLAISLTVLLNTITRIITPVKKLMLLVSEVKQGNMDAQVDSTLPVPKDEIGILINDVYSLIGVIKSMLGDLTQLTSELSTAGNNEFQIETNKYSGSYKEIIDGIQTLGKSISMKNKAMAVMDVIENMVSVSDFNYNVLYLNEGIIKAYGIDRENCYKQKCYKAVRNLDAPCPICRMRDLMSLEEQYPVTEYSYVFDDCLGRWLGGKSAIINWVDGSRVLCNSFLDESRVKSYEEQLRDIAQRAEAASVAKSVFLANMSHEIRTPMNSIVGFSELALDDSIPAKTRDYLVKILENAEGLLQIINDILDISKVESGKMELEHIPFDLHDLIAQCRTAVIPKAMEKGLQLYFYAEPSVGKELLGDPTRLRQVLTNLLTNAVKFTNTGMVKCSSGIKDTTGNKVVLSFEVKDSGIGMTEEQMAKIYDPFTQADSSTTRKYGGTGLGLSICKNFIELMGGKLSVESTPGIGTKFSFDLAFDTIDKPAGIPRYRNYRRKIEKPVFSGEILVCEDNSMNQFVIGESLAKVGLSVVMAENGLEGVNMVRERMEKGKKPFDLIFMDIQMPVMDGLEAASKITELQTGTPIVAMTANIMSGEKDLYKTKGMPDNVSKPFTSQELWHCLMKYFTPLNVANNNAQQDSDKEFHGIMRLLFVKNNLKKFDEIAKALEANDIELAHRLVHTLKSNAGQIGKTHLQSAAAEVERQLKDGKNLASEEQLRLLASELSGVLGELLPLLEEHNMAGGRPDAV